VPSISNILLKCSESETTNCVSYIPIELQAMIVERDLSLKLYRKLGSYNIFAKYKQLKYQIKSSLKQHKIDSINGIISKNSKNPKQLWKFMNLFIKSSSCESIEHINLNGISITDRMELATAFNQYFIGLIPNLLKSIPCVLPKNPFFVSLNDSFFLSTPKFVFSEILPENTLVFLSSIKPSSLDGKYLSLEVVNIAMDQFVFAFTYFINDSFQKGVFPAFLKYAKVIPVFKNESKHEIVNYRPISILTSYSKLFEKAAHYQFINYLSKYHLLPSNQFGFIQGNSTESAILFLLSCITNVLNSKLLCAVVFLDYSKAFDSVSHQLLVNKLRDKFNLSDLALKWFKSYLTERYQYVSIDGKTSKPNLIKYGVPQGSVL
jgi:hypothetical protein